MLCLALSTTTKDISVCWDSKKKVKTQQTGEKFLISLWLYISDFGEPNFCEPSLSVRRWWLEVWWRVRKPWDQKQLIHGCTLEGPDVTGEVVEGFREQRWFDWIVFWDKKRWYPCDIFGYEFRCDIFGYEFLMFNTFTSMWYATCLELSVMHCLYKRRSIY